MTAIYKRELRSYFHSMIGYVFIAFLVAFTGIYFMAYNLNYGYPYFSYVLSSITFILLIAIPILTMRSFAEDRKNKTDQMLLTYPVSLHEVVLGKYFAMISILAVCDLFDFPIVDQSTGDCVYKRGLSGNSGLLSVGMCVCVYWNVHFFADRKPDHSCDWYFWCSPDQLSLEWDYEFYCQCRLGESGRCDRDFVTSGISCMENDKKLAAGSRSGSGCITGEYYTIYCEIVIV